MPPRPAGGSVRPSGSPGLSGSGKQAAAPGNPAPGRLFVDSIIASVNDSAILQSRLFATIGGELLGEEERLQRPLSPEEIQQLQLRDLRKLIGNYQMAQSARSFGNFPPERFDQILESELKRDEEDLRRDLGSYAAVSNELERRGETWQTYARGQRVEKLQMLAEQFAIYERLRKQQNLYLTPRMLRETYRQYESEFKRPASAQLAMVVCTGPTAKQNAADVAAFWRTGDFEPREVAERFPRTTATQIMQAASLPAVLKSFAMAGPLGNVSEPIARGSSWAVAKVWKLETAVEGQFSDPEVQARVRQIATNKVILEFRMQALQRARRRTEVWLYERGRPIPLQNR
ncbi:MAG: hypothetical protein AB8H80_13415 [Planctomycetota bacterium]